MTPSTVEILRWHTPEGTVLLGASPQGGLELRTPRERPGRGVVAAVLETLASPPDRRHPLARIVRGLGSDSTRPIVDATAGLGGDASVAAIADPTRRVVACERHPLLSAMLEHEVRRARAAGHEAAARMEVRPVDATTVLEAFDPASGPALVILDPMFPPRRRASALPPKPMQRLRELAETPDPDAAERDAAAMLDLAAAAGAGRIVLKRPPEARIPESSLGRPTFEIETRLVRWMVWERGEAAGG